MPVLLPTSTEAERDASLRAAVARLAEGGLVALPTETVYGLGARADQAQAVARIFAAKGRPSDHPLIVHVADAAAAEAYAAEIPPLARRLMDAFWPGPLTVIVPRRPGVAAEAAGGQASVGLRCPSHPVAQALLREAARAGVSGVAAPSANRFGRVSPTRATHVMSEFAGQPEAAGLLVLEGGECEVGIESAIVDCSRGHPVLLRPGSLGRAQIEAAAGEPLLAPDAQAPRASGTLAAHYAPRAKVRLMDRAALEQGLGVLASSLAEASRASRKPPTLAVYSRLPKPAGISGVVWRTLPSDPAAVAHELFGALRDFDDAQVSLIWVEEPPADSAWDGVRDRLQRAAAA
ncbi:L-threonylcarbamoyladenylate synthase [Leptothrix discophora]|uniref:Threonylcarbamoyl-AMP synthase n=1 Tax=Leptothrix discophora TaxID=89 RepID=A0ABT9G805_LEPDI|nr:L-threonylcarbamoyladenylate synthase [Leptothrix discophora]MDP4302313.1 L-threonylcarbamoyladenylate synthase [Leptothrix discophora]